MKGNLTLSEITMNVLVFAPDWASAQAMQDIADREGAKLIRGRSEANHDSIYSVTGFAIGKFRQALSASGFQHKIQP